MARAFAPGKTDNLAELENLNEATLLQELKIRFQRKEIYTYVGEILVTVNPFEWIPGIYTAEKMSEYRSIGNKNALSPHVFATADIAFTTMVSSGQNQVCVISGESGAGKTEAAKLFVKQLVNVSQGAEFEGLENKLIEVNPVLEAFGNAKTLFNNNSSRFGKYTSVKFNSKGQVKGAEMTEYLLEKSRVVSQADGEQNFHVFYLFFQGMGKNPTYALNAIEEHRYCCGNDEAIKYVNKGPSGKGFAVEYDELMACFTTVGFSEDQIKDLFQTLSGIIHLGDVEFEGDDEARVVSDAAVMSTLCDQLGIDEYTVELAMTRQVNVIRGEEVERKLKLEQAEDVRDATAKAIYTRAFSWIVKECNQQLMRKEISSLPDDTSMGILDIFGFENFDHNSLEQLCINLTNEQLQWYFNEFIFAMELKEYEAEGINGKNITYEKNEPLLELLLHAKPLGLLGILDEESNFPKATDSTMITKFHNAFKGHKDYTAPRGNDDIFSLHHYAGVVQYEGYGFLEKNRDTLAVDVVGALRISENSLVKVLFGGEESKKGAKGKRGKIDRAGAQGKMRQSIRHARNSLAKKPTRTVAANFKSSLLNLKEQLLASAPHFIRCVKPNHQKVAQVFDDDLVTKQLRYTGMLETTRIRREGYSSRPLFGDFVHRYKVLGFPCRQDVPATAASCRQILNKAGISGFEVGKTKVFMRYFHADELNGKLEPFTAAATVLSKYCRGFTGRARYTHLVKAKREQDKQVNQFITHIERGGQGMRDVIISLCEEDDKRPASGPGSLLEQAPAKPAARPSKKKGMARAASVKWFREVEANKGSGKTDDGGFADWFHGIITRAESEELLRGQTSGTFLIRVAESRFGYSLSLMFQGRCKHFMIDQNDEDRYLVVGNDRTFPSLNEVVAFHMKHPVTDDGDTLIRACPTSGPRDDLAELE
eukprot:m.21052 g.21052  ORF g.21052 m.21052 type:complete len:934 (+) comp7017_c0_seq1:165-2966(+)